MKNSFRIINSRCEGMPRFKLKLCKHEGMSSNPGMSRCLGLTVQPALPTWKAEASEKLCLCKQGGQCQRSNAKVFSGLHTYFTQMYPKHARIGTYIHKRKLTLKQARKETTLADFPVAPRHWVLLEEQTCTPESGLGLRRFCTVTIWSWITL